MLYFYLLAQSESKPLQVQVAPTEALQKPEVPPKRSRKKLASQLLPIKQGTVAPAPSEPLEAASKMQEAAGPNGGSSQPVNSMPAYGGRPDSNAGFGAGRPDEGRQNDQADDRTAFEEPIEITFLQPVIDVSASRSSWDKRMSWQSESCILSRERSVAEVHDPGTADPD